MVTDINRHFWSSYPATAGSQLASGQNISSPWPALKSQVLLGSAQFLEQMQPLLAGIRDIKEMPRDQRLAHRPDLEAIFSTHVCEDKRVRDETIRRAYLGYGYTMAAIARQTKIHYSTVSRIIKRER